MKPSQEKDTYKTLLAPAGEVLYKEKNSKFFGYAFPLHSMEQADALLEEIRTNNRKASHLCYAWQWGLEEPYFRVNDDGEPTHSAGMPIYGQIQAFGLTNVLVAVVRIYGGRKLGVGGLIQAYRMAAKLALESGKTVNRTVKTRFALNFDYPQLDSVLRFLNQQGIVILEQELLERCQLQIEVRLRDVEAVENKLKGIQGVLIRRVSRGK